MDKYWYLAIKQNGKMKNARRVIPTRHKAFQFLTLEDRTYNQASERQKFENREIKKIIEKLQSSFDRKEFSNQ